MVDEQSVSEQYLKISPCKVETIVAYPVGTHDIKVQIIGDIVQQLTNDQQDGTVKMTYVLKAHTIEVV
jgi:hypothetical protein